ncbi:MAG: hypothetical protein HXY23_13860 [Parvularculaceae bacterium]|nr:hypothetical protein [Parvularculaceae bacterium]
MTRASLFLIGALAALAACGNNDGSADAVSAPSAESGASKVSPLDDPAAEPIEGDASSAWVEMMGVWAETGRCADDTGRWIIEAEAFHLYEMHCAIEKLDLLKNGVKATAQCTIEGDNDGVADVYYFLRQGDGSITIAAEGSMSMNAGLFLCEGEETEI